VSWESTAIYYRLLNEIVRERVGGLHSAKLLLWSFDFAEIAERQHSGDWAGAATLLIDAARKLDAAGADGLALCTNTTQKLADDVQAAVTIPLIILPTPPPRRSSARAPAGRHCSRPGSPWSRIFARAG
jgi:aspartate racemase